MLVSRFKLQFWSKFRHTSRLIRAARLCAKLLLVYLSLVPYFIRIPFDEMLVGFPSLEDHRSVEKARLLKWL